MRGGHVEDLLRLLESFGDIRTPDRVDALRGLSTRNFLVVFDADDWVVRLASANAERLGISRTAEGEALRLAHAAGLGPELIHHQLPKGHLVSRYIDAQEFSQAPDEYRKPASLSRIIHSVKRIHQMPSIDHAFDPFERIRAAFRRAVEHAVPLPEQSQRLLDRLDSVQTARGPLESASRALCHNDLFAGNLLDADPVRVIDWEFAGMGDIFFDLATLVVATDEFAPLGDEHRDQILTAYFGAAGSARRRRLDDMVFVVRLHVVAWGLTHHVLDTPAHGWEGFTFLGFATDLMDQLLSEV